MKNKYKTQSLYLDNKFSSSQLDFVLVFVKLAEVFPVLWVKQGLDPP